MSAATTHARAHASAQAVRSALLVLGASMVVASLFGCTTDGTEGTTDQAVVVSWARDDLGFGDSADCLVPYLGGIDLGGATRADLQRHQLDGLPIQSRQRIGDALVVCGISEPDR